MPLHSKGGGKCQNNKQHNANILYIITTQNQLRSDFKCHFEKLTLKSATIIQYTIKGRFMSR